MLKILRSNTKALIWFFIFLFALWCLGSAISIKGETHTVAKINGRDISQPLFDQFQKIIQFSPRYNQILETQPTLPTQFLTDTTLQYLALYFHAKKMKIRISDNEVREVITARFSQSGIFQEWAYTRWLNNVYRGPARLYEEGVRNELIIDKLMKQLRDATVTTEEEIDKAFALEHESVSIRYLVFPFPTLTKLNPSNDQLLQFYENNKNLFAIPAKYDLTYLFFDWRDELPHVVITENEVDEFYKILQKNAAETTKLPAFNEAKPQLLKQLQIRQARVMAANRAAAAQSVIQESRNFSKGADVTGKQAFRTGLKNSQELSKDFKTATNIEQLLEAMSPSSLRLIEGANGTYVTLQTNKEFGYTAPPTEIQDRLIAEYTKNQAEKISKNDAENALTKLFSEKISFDQLAASLGILPQSALDITHASTQLPVHSSTELLQALLPLKTNDILEIPWPSKDGYLLIQLLERKISTKEPLASLKKIFAEQYRVQAQDKNLQMQLATIIQTAKITPRNSVNQDPFSQISDDE